jgi:hypothetical protein
LLRADDLPPFRRSALARAYAAALSWLPPTLARERLEELFQIQGDFPAGYSTDRYYSLCRLAVVEAAAETLARR